VNRARVLFWAVVLTGAGGVAAIACTLNPQPLPPESAGAAPGDKNSGDTAQEPSPPMGVGDAGGGGVPDGAGARNDGGNDTDATTGQPDGGSDAAIDAPLDGNVDGATTD
jgi:hypothetical protein